MAEAPTPIRLTDSDRAALGFAAEHRFVLAGHLARVLGVSEAAAGRRLRRLRAAGLVSSSRRLHHAPTAFAVTRRGLTAIGSDLAAPRAIDLGEYRHDVGLAWLAAGARGGRFGAGVQVLEERRMRSEDRRAGRAPDAPMHGLRLAPSRGGEPGRHYPDLVLATPSGRRVAFELELSTKTPARRERILAAYAAARRIDQVVYLVPDARSARAIERSAARVGLGDRVRVQRFRWAGDRPPDAPALAGGRGRSAGRERPDGPRRRDDPGRGLEP